jgi:hypothetical protein
MFNLRERRVSSWAAIGSLVGWQRERPLTYLACTWQVSCTRPLVRAGGQHEDLHWEATADRGG